jgi:hypothetical protein
MTKNDRDLIDRLRNDVTIIYENENLGEIFVSSPRKIELEAADALEAQAGRIAELEKMLAVHRLAVDVDALKARIAALEAENEELKKAISKPWMGSARAAYLGDKE